MTQLKSKKVDPSGSCAAEQKMILIQARARNEMGAGLAIAKAVFMQPSKN